VSEYLPASDTTKEVVFKVDFEQISRLKSIKVQWTFLPEEIKIEYYTDPKLMVWDVAKNWYRLQKKTAEAHVWDHQVFRYMLFAKGIRIVMRGTGPSARYGIQSIQAFTAPQTAIFIEKSSRKVPRCWASAENDYNVWPRPHMLMNCLTALDLNDSREIYVLDEHKITHFADEFCVGGLP